MLWEGSKMTVVYYDKRPSDVWPCDVRITGDEIVVGYESDVPTTYEGKDLGSGHYILESSQEHGKASLHRAPGSPYLEGFWFVEGTRGMWRIELSDTSGQEPQ